MIRRRNPHLFLLHFLQLFPKKVTRCMYYIVLKLITNYNETGDPRSIHYKCLLYLLKHNPHLLNWMDMKKVDKSLFKKFWNFNKWSLHFIVSRIALMGKSLLEIIWWSNFLRHSKNETFEGNMVSMATFEILRQYFKYYSVKCSARNTSSVLRSLSSIKDSL